MATEHKLSLFTAILININIMMGSGLFINTVLLSKEAGSLSALSYLLIGILLLPLIIGMSQLVQCNLKGGTFYHFGEAISPFAGFVSSWSYFTAKLGSFTLAIHVCNSLIQQLIPTLKAIPTLNLDAIVIFLFMLLNMFNLKMGKSIQYAFIGLKLIPILFAILSGFFLFSGSNFNNSTIWLGVPTTIPFVLFAFLGFEASCSISKSLHNPEKNASRAILISYFIVVTIVILYQLIFWGNLGWELAKLPNYLQAFPALINKLNLESNYLKNTLLGLMNIGIASSALGASYGMMFTNGWNLFTLAENGHTFFNKTLVKLNSQNIPYYCIIVQAIIALTYLIISQGNQIPLQQIGALGCTLAYAISSIALIFIKYKDKKSLFIPILSLVSSLILSLSFIWNIKANGLTLLLVFFSLLWILGILMFIRKRASSN